MTCGVCGSNSVTGPYYADSVEPHGETHTDEYYKCGGCKSEIDERDVYPDEDLEPRPMGRESGPATKIEVA